MDGTEEKTRLIELLDRSRRETIAAMRGIDDYAPVYPEAGWRVKDILAHIAIWEREALASLQSFHEGESYSLGEAHDGEAYNREKFQQRYELDPAQVRMDWFMVRRDLQFAVADLDPDRIDDPLLLPWHAFGTVTTLIEEMVTHEAQHLSDLMRVVRRQ